MTHSKSWFPAAKENVPTFCYFLYIDWSMFVRYFVSIIENIFAIHPSLVENDLYLFIYLYKSAKYLLFNFATSKCMLMNI